MMQQYCASCENNFEPDISQAPSSLLLSTNTAHVACMPCTITLLAEHVTGFLPLQAADDKQAVRSH